MKLAADAAAAAIEAEVAGPLGLSIDEAALAIIDLGTEAMVNAIEEITVKQGIDPEDTIMIGGGGAAGLNGVAIARRLRCRTVVFPDAGAALSAAGAMMSELRAEAAQTEFMRTTHFDCDRANRIPSREVEAGGTSRLRREPHRCGDEQDRIRHRGPLPKPSMGNRSAAPRRLVCWRA